MSVDDADAKWLRILGPLVVAVVGISMCAWTWTSWPDPVVDFGRELYVPWRLAEGDVLYRDVVSYFNGPLSPYAHALLFKVFGPSLRVLVIFNLAVTALLVAMLYRLIARAAGHLAATAAGVVFFTLFAFAQYLTTGNFNYVCPYSYELTHGIALTLAMITCLDLWSRRGRVAWLVATGALLGLVFLTKAEVFFGAAVAVGVGFAAVSWLRRPRSARLLADIGILLGCALVPAIVAAGLLSLAMPVGDAIRGILGAWRWVNDDALLGLPYFRQLAGTANPAGSVGAMLNSAFCYVVLFVPAVLLAYTTGQLGRRAQLVIAGAVFVVVAGAGLLFWRDVNWHLLVRAAPVFLVAMLVVVLVLLARRRAVELILPLALIAWAGAMLAKIPLNVVVQHYGFALAMPATMVLVAALVGWGPRAVRHFDGSGAVFAAVALAAVVVTAYTHVRWTAVPLGMKTESVGSGGDRFRADRRAVAVNALVEHLARSSGPSDTLVVAPEGLLVNYLARRVNPTGQLNFTPPAMIMYGESSMLAAFERRPPDWIALTSIDSSEYGARLFGEDYAKDLHSWIVRHYQPVETFRVILDQQTMFEIRLLRRR